MPNFNELTQTEIEKQSKKYKRNPEKQKAFEKVVNSKFLKTKNTDNNRIETFERLWKEATTLTRKTRSFGKNKNYLSFSENVGLLVTENTFYKSSVLENFISANGKNITEKLENAERKTYEERTDVFFAKYGTEEITYKDETKTLNEFFEDYQNGKISKEVMNDIIAEFESSNEEYLSVDYSYKNNESTQSLINEVMER